MAPADARTLPSPERRIRPQLEVGEEVEELVDVLEPNPTYVLDARWDLLHWNRAAELLFTNWNRRPAHERNILWFYLCDPYARRLYVDWEAEARGQLAHFREAVARFRTDAAASDLLEEIFAVTPEAESWWQSGDEPPGRSGIRRVRLPDHREVGLRQLVLEVADTPQIQVVTYFAGWDDSEDSEGSDDD
jgi:hypothetical protein